MNENQQNKDLQILRQEIDKIDSQILHLLTDRMEIIEKVASLKKSGNRKFYIHSNREADMIKNLINLSQNKLPKSTIINIWRKIITTANTSEQNLKIAIHNPKNISDFSYIVKEYYNNEIPIINLDSSNSVVSELESDNCQIGIFALPMQFEEGDKKEDTKENWWISLANNKIGLKVFAKIPFMEFTQTDKNFIPTQLVSVAIKEPEPSEDDNTLIVIETAKDINKTSILNCLKELNLEGKILKSAQILQFDGIKFHLIELDGFYHEDDSIIKDLARSKIKPYIKVLGHYAKPILI